MAKALIIAGGILAFLLLSYFCAQMHSPAVTATAPLAAPSLWGSISDGRITLTGMLPDEATKNSVVEAATNTYGATNVIDELKISSGVSKANWLPAGLGIFGLLKDGVKKAGFGLADNKLTINGIVKNNDIEAKLLADARAAFPTTELIDNVDIEATAVQKDIGKFLETRIIEFATGSAVILPRGKAILDTVAMMLAEAPDALIEVSGHTDNQGDNNANQILSQRRADATESYLIKKGIADQRMTAKGYGETQPVADNETPEGRQRNRRIQFGLR